MKLGEKTPASENARRVRLLGDERRRLSQRRRILRLKAATLRQAVQATGDRRLTQMLETTRREIESVTLAMQEATDLMLFAWEKRQRAIVGPRRRRRPQAEQEAAAV